MLLAIDTCGATGSIALGRLSNASAGGASMQLLGQTELAGKTFSAQLVPRLRELLHAHAVTAQDIEAIVIVNGPGSFTGVRIGVSAAKGLAEALHIPVIAVSRLALLAQKAGTQAAAFYAGRSEIYFGRYLGGEIYETLLPIDPVLPQQILAQTGHPLAICEPGLSSIWSEALYIEPPTAADALTAAASRLLAHDYDEVAALDGNYVRRSDTELFARPAAVSR